MKQIDRLINDIWEDGWLDQEEKSLLKELALVCDVEELSYIRNRCFDIAQQKVDAGSDAKPTLVSLQKVVKLLSSVQSSIQGSQQFACFSPGEQCRDTIISLLNKARKKIDICVFTISDNKLSEAILSAHVRGVQVRIITDNDKANDKGSDIDYLASQGVSIVFDKTSNHMHHKFALVDDVLINGSFNWTRSATQYNQENITVNNSTKLLALFSEQFNLLWNMYS